MTYFRQSAPGLGDSFNAANPVPGDTRYAAPDRIDPNGGKWLYTTWPASRTPPDTRPLAPNALWMPDPAALVVKSTDARQTVTAGAMLAQTAAPPVPVASVPTVVKEVPVVATIPPGALPLHTSAVRLGPDGTTALVTNVPTRGGKSARVVAVPSRDLHGIVTGIVDTVTNVAGRVSDAAQAVSDEAKRIRNATQGAAAGAEAGYSAPVKVPPWLFYGGLAAGAVALYKFTNRRR